MSSESFASLNINTISEYFDQTLWQSVFGVLAFILAFVVLYFVANLLVNLLNHVIRFPLVRKIDWVLGGVLGLLRGIVFATLILCVLEPTITAFSVDLMNTLKEGSRTYAIFAGEGAFDLLGVRNVINEIVLSGSSLLM